MFRDILLEPTLHNTFIVRKKLEYKNVQIKKGFETNGADIPRILWCCIPPFQPKFLVPIIFHDYLCKLKMFDLANEYFEELILMIEDSVSSRNMIRGVKLYAKTLPKNYGKICYHCLKKNKELKIHRSRILNVYKGCDFCGSKHKTSFLSREIFEQQLLLKN